TALLPRKSAAAAASQAAGALTVVVQARARAAPLLLADKPGTCPLPLPPHPRVKPSESKPLAAGVSSLVWIGLGANLGERAGALRSALAAIAALPGTSVRRVSS